MLFGKKHEDTRQPNARLADGDKVWVPGQTKSLTEMVLAGRKVSVPLGPIEDPR
jgi:hypothetical protein